MVVQRARNSFNKLTYQMHSSEEWIQGMGFSIFWAFNDYLFIYLFIIYPNYTEFIIQIQREVLTNSRKGEQNPSETLLAFYKELETIYPWC